MSIIGKIIRNGNHNVPEPTGLVRMRAIPRGIRARLKILR